MKNLELHYHLKDGSHSMNATIRNKCESESLALFLEIAKSLDIKIEIESTAYNEGGLREIWKFIGNNNSQLTLILAIIVLIYSRVPISDPEMDKLNKEIAKLTIDEKKLNIQKLKDDFESNINKEKALKNAASFLENQIKIATHRSNFYKNISDYEKVTGIGVAENDNPEKYIDRSEFSRFILHTDKLPTETIENAKIEIIAPVLKEGNYQWKGMYEKKIIAFSMKDEAYKIQVLTKQIKFQHGSEIECSLQIHRKFDELGDVKITGYTVTTVLSTTDGANKMETIQGKRKKSNKKLSNAQGKLNLD